MQAKLLELHFSQLQSAWAVARYNSYSDVRKNSYHKNLEKIINCLKSEDFSGLDEHQILERYWVIFFVFKSLEFLNHSTTSTIPFEMVYVLERALEDWLQTKDYIIVTSLVAGMDGFSFDGSLAFPDFDFLFDSISNLYGVTFDHRLLQITLPESTSRDYLSNVALYHELGHFVELKHQITLVIYNELLATLVNGTDFSQKNDILRFFPYLTDPNAVKHFQSSPDRYNRFGMHIGEYFCDLFAAQYIQDSLNYYLEYITRNQTVWNPTHPSTVNRILFVNEYLDNKGKFVLAEFKRIIHRITNIHVGYKGKDISTANFESLIPVNIQDVRELHGVFIYGWKVWMANWENIRQKAGIEFPLSNENVYSIVNNLIEKTIGNFIVKQEWESTKINP